MRLLRNIAAFLLLALWLPTTQHCLLAAAELITETHVEGDSCCAEPLEGCTDSSCFLLEGGDFRPTDSSVGIPLPSNTACLCILCVTTSTLALEADAEADTACVSFERPSAFSPTWQFVQRAALCPRAPSVALA